EALEDLDALGSVFALAGGVLGGLAVGLFHDDHIGFAPREPKRLRGGFAPVRNAADAARPPLAERPSRHGWWCSLRGLRRSRRAARDSGRRGGPRAGRRA